MGGASTACVVITAHRLLSPTMPRKAKATAPGPKRKISITPAPDLAAWVHERSGPGKQFASFTHAVERGLVLLKEHEEGKWQPSKK